jgi:hypothetical protein
MQRNIPKPIPSLEIDQDLPQMTTPSAQPMRKTESNYLPQITSQKFYLTSPSRSIASVPSQHGNSFSPTSLSLIQRLLGQNSMFAKSWNMDKGAQQNEHPARQRSGNTCLA